MIMQHAHHGIENHIVMQLNLNVDEFEICIYMLLYMKKRGVYTIHNFFEVHWVYVNLPRYMLTCPGI